MLSRAETTHEALLWEGPRRAPLLAAAEGTEAAHQAMRDARRRDEDFLLAREIKRSRDYDDGIIAGDDH